MSRTSRSNGSLAFGDTAAIIVLAASGLVVVGAISMVSGVMNRLWPGVSKVGPISVDPVAQIQPTGEATGLQTPPPAAMTQAMAQGKISAQLALVRHGTRLTLAFDPPPDSGLRRWANVETFDSLAKAMERVAALAKLHPACILEVDDKT